MVAVIVAWLHTNGTGLIMSFADSLKVIRQQLAIEQKFIGITLIDENVFNPGTIMNETGGVISSPIGLIAPQVQIEATFSPITQ